MIKNTYQVIGLMSGTSLDGLDIAFCQFDLNAGQWTYQIIETSSIPYPKVLEDRLRQAIHQSAQELLLLHVEYGKWCGEALKDFIHQYQLNPDFIASHGHTVFHQPEKRLTTQIGCGYEIAINSKFPVVADFRTLDVRLGGQGAPLVPIGDQLLFGDYDFCLNLGGISNVSFELEGQRIAYDIGPANMLLNHLAQQAGKPYDQGGKMAATGNVDPEMLQKLNKLDYYQKPYPKSLGFEWFLAEIIPILNQSTASIQDQLATANQHISQIIITELLKVKKEGVPHLLITGGGAKNHFLIESMRQFAEGKIKICIPDELVIDFKEAMIFAFMGVRKMRGEVNALSSVTGAKTDNCGGVIYQNL